MSFVDDPIDEFLRRASIKHQVVEGTENVVTFQGELVLRNVMNQHYAGTLVIEPKRGYIKAVDYVRTDASGTVTNSMKFTVNDKPGTTPILSRAVIAATIKNTAGVVTSTSDGVIESSITYPTDIPEDRFTLSVYGFPEPEGVVWDKPTPTYVWLLVAANSFALLAALFTALKRRAGRVRVTPLVTS